MKTFTPLAVLVAMVALVCSPVPAMATTISECQGAIATQILDTQGTAFSGGVGNKASQCKDKCLADLSRASRRLDQARWAEAVAAIEQYGTDVTFCTAKGFIHDGDEVALLTEAAAVISCIEHIGQ